MEKGYLVNTKYVYLIVLLVVMSAWFSRGTSKLPATAKAKAQAQDQAQAQAQAQENNGQKVVQKVIKHSDIIKLQHND